MRTAKLPYVIGIFNLTTIAVFLVHYLNRTYPLVGQDFAYFVPRLLDTHLHYLINGLEVQWYTPSFGGGLPAFPNPQQIQFSLLQFLLFVLDPWRSILVCVTLFAWIGYLSCYFFLRHTVALNWQASTLGSLFFAVNGFYLNHMTVGHIGYLTYPLLPVLLISMLDQRIPIVLAAIAMSIILASLVHGAGFYLIVVFALSILVALPIVYFIRPAALKPTRMLIVMAAATPLTLGMTASKIYAVQSFMRFFPREIYEQYQNNIVGSLIGIIWQLSAATLINPVRFLFGRQPDDLAGILAGQTAAPFDLWELDTSLGGILLIGVFAGAVFQIVAVLKHRRWPSLGQWTALVLLAISTWVVVDLATTRGAIYEFAKSLPFVRSLHVNVRFTAAFILPIIILGAYFLDHGMRILRRKDFAIIALHLAAVVSLGTYYLVSPQAHDRAFEISESLLVYTMMEQGEKFPISEIADVSDAKSFMRRASSRRPYEPVFGYWLESFAARTTEGSVFLQDGEFLNMTNPASLVFPEVQSRSQFERFRANEIGKLHAFLERRQPDWNIPLPAHLLNWTALLTIVLEAAILFGFAWRYLSARCRTALAAPGRLSQLR